MRAYIAIALAFMLLFYGCLGAQQTQQSQGTGASKNVSEPKLSVSVNILDIPQVVDAEQNFSIAYAVNANKEVPAKINLVYGKNSIPFPQSESDYEFSTQAESLTAPTNMLTQLALNSSGTYFFRAHAVVNGVDYWSEEHSVNVVGQQPMEADVKVYNIGISKDGISLAEITEPVNTKVRLVFSSNVDKEVTVDVQGFGSVTLEPRGKKSIDLTTALGYTFFTVKDS
ncbi:MAG: hypothetical protein D6769_02540, partial [Methanobacteriota archaeon]